MPQPYLWLQKADPKINVVEAILYPGLILPQCGIWLQREDPLFTSPHSLSNPGFLSVVWHERYMPFFSVRGRKGREDPQEINNTKGGFPHTHISHLHEATQVCPPVFGTNHGSTMRSKMRQSCRRVRYWTTARVSYLAIIRFYYFSPHHHLLNIIQYFHVQYFHWLTSKGSVLKDIFRQWQSGKFQEKRWTVNIHW